MSKKFKKNDPIRFIKSEGTHQFTNRVFDRYCNTEPGTVWYWALFVKENREVLMRAQEIVLEFDFERIVHKEVKDWLEES